MDVMPEVRYVRLKVPRRQFLKRVCIVIAVALVLLYLVLTYIDASEQFRALTTAGLFLDLFGVVMVAAPLVVTPKIPEGDHLFAQEPGFREPIQAAHEYKLIPTMQYGVLFIAAGFMLQLIALWIH